MKALRLTWPVAVAAALIVLALGGILANKSAQASLTDQFRCVIVPTLVAAEGSDWKRIDDRKLVFEMEEALEDLAVAGYEVIDIAPITRGPIESQEFNDAEWTGGYGMTQGLLITAEKP
jgi:hypothetical protein